MIWYYLILSLWCFITYEIHDYIKGDEEKASEKNAPLFAFIAIFPVVNVIAMTWCIKDLFKKGK